ncbi:hypothetical protein [Nocardia sp. NPDC002869]|uniref:scabin-related ADP-ribosyltransferase n=1 Tax=Nocardia sp. NPDC002869 TaxID=3161032 RepID=UPI00398CE532
MSKVLVEAMLAIARRAHNATGQVASAIRSRYSGTTGPIRSGATGADAGDNAGAALARSVDTASIRTRRGQDGSSARQPADEPRRVDRDGGRGSGDLGTRPRPDRVEKPAPPVFAMDTDPPPSYQDIRRYVAQHRMPASFNPNSSVADLMLDESTWGEAMRLQRVHLGSRGITGREFDQGMWELADRLEREAREGGFGLPFSAGLRYRLPYMRTVYRGDTRPPAIIFEHGFTPRGDNRDLGDHQGEYGDSAYIGTSTEHANAADHADGPHGYGADGYVYVIRDATGGVDVDHWNLMRDGSLLAPENEIAFEGGIPADKVMGVLRDKNDPSAGIIENPNYVPARAASGVRDDTGPWVRPLPPDAAATP